MSKKNVFIVMVFLIVAGISYFYISKDAVISLFKYKNDIVKDIHSDILKLIANTKKSIKN